MAQAEPLAGSSEGEGFVAGAVVGHDALDGDAEACIVGDGGLEKGDGAALAFGLHHSAEGDARGIVDADVDELPADAAVVALACAVAGDAVPYPVELAELFDVDVDELARPIALVTAWRLSRLQGAHPVEAEPLEDAADGGRRDAGFGGDGLAGQALTTKGFDAIDDGLHRRSVQAVRP